ncbi:MAG: TetR/AcrR family transcriptional regulator [Actinomycetota bacterium]
MAVTERSYHHGDLNQTLRMSAADLIAERGAGGFSLREVARRAGVSHAAPAHHFGDVTGLLTAVATDAFIHLHANTAAAWEHTDGTAVDRFAAVGRAYVELGVSHPGHCAVVFRQDLIRGDDPEYMVEATKAYAVLNDALVAVAAEVNPDLDIDLAAATSWSAMQGLIELRPILLKQEQGHARVVPEHDVTIGDLAERISRMLVDGFRPRSA